MLDISEHYLTHDEEQLLLDLSRASLDTWVRSGQRIDLNLYSLTDTLQAFHSAFVTLRVAGGLRGCIGSTVNTEPLVQSVCNNTIGAASRDPRFDAVRPEELDQLRIEISAMTPGDSPETPFKRVDTIDAIRVGRDGLYLETAEGARGLLLPQVATERNWNAEQFLTATCLKAGATEDAWQRSGTAIYRFSAQVFGES